MTTELQTFPGELPAGLRCGFCNRPIEGQFFRTFKRFACVHCAAQAQDLIRRNAFDPAAFALGAAAGLLVAVVSAIAWAGIVAATQWEIGIVASFIGVLVGKAVYIASGQRRGIAYQWLCVVLSVLGVAGGKVALAGWALHNAAVAQNASLTPIQLLRGTFYFVTHDPQDVFRAFDLVWIGIAVYAAWRICRPLPIVIAGPYAYTSVAATGGLQFQTVEPASTPAPANPPADQP
ncbi:MAG: hypothetical protein JO353_13850 [Phycisphaerae bacterium]|nr:hypothetical protein [Phycisphaerae bacterium]